MHLKLIPPSQDVSNDVLARIFQIPGAGRLLAAHWLRSGSNGTQSQSLWVPANWLNGDQGRPHQSSLKPLEDGKLPMAALRDAPADGLLIVNAQLECRYDDDMFSTIQDTCDTEALAVDIAPDLAAPNDLVRLTSNHQVVGFRRILADTVEPTPLNAAGFPALLYLSPSACRKLSDMDALPLEFDAVCRCLADRDISVRRVRMGGRCCDLNTPQGVMTLLERLDGEQMTYRAASAQIAPSARIIGPVRIDADVRIEDNAVIVGPAIVGKGVRIGAGAVVRRAVLADAISVAPAEVLQNTLYLAADDRRDILSSTCLLGDDRRTGSAYRDWPLLSYPRCGKRLFDIVFSLFILLLVSPILLAAVVMIKLTSPGPIFYVARRQGRHGRDFGCLKFRTMMVQADNLQEKLRYINQVDGPQFKMDNDPRITGVGKFLRDTCIDELPQFINVLAGQMSVVGPRPSPENENESCPAWRDARLSVRPGITGLWQVCRTRRTGQDFQEWVYYDTRYVRNLSFRQDMWICYKTAIHLINTFLNQFG